MPIVSFDGRSTITGLNLCVNTFHVSVGAQPTATEANNILAPVKAFYDAIATYRTTGTNVVVGSRVLYFSESWWTKPTFDSNHNMLTKGGFNTEPIILGATPATSTVGSGGNAQPPQLACVLSWRTATSGRSGRGRTYLGNLGAAAANNDKIVSAAVTAINSAAATLITALRAVTVGGASTTVFAVWSPTKGIARDIISGATDATWDTMRSRVK